MVDPRASQPAPLVLLVWLMMANSRGYVAPPEVRSLVLRSVEALARVKVGRRPQGVGL
jgi:hypothetical protein